MRIRDRGELGHLDVVVVDPKGLDADAQGQAAAVGDERPRADLGHVAVGHGDLDVELVGGMHETVEGLDQPALFRGGVRAILAVHVAGMDRDVVLETGDAAVLDTIQEHVLGQAVAARDRIGT